MLFTVSDSDTLAAFADDTDAPCEQESQPSILLSTLILERQSRLYFLEADRVDSVLPATKTFPLPHTHQGIAGVFQNRGRVITVLRDVLASTEQVEQPKARRLIVCETSQGLLAVPADRTLTVGSVTISAAPVHGQAVELEPGVATFICPEELAQTICKTVTH